MARSGNEVGEEGADFDFDVFVLEDLAPAEAGRTSLKAMSVRDSATRFDGR